MKENMKEIGNTLFKHDLPLILCHVGQLGPVGLIDVLFQKIGFEFDLKAVQ